MTTTRDDVTKRCFKMGALGGSVGGTRRLRSNGPLLWWLAPPPGFTPGTLIKGVNFSSVPVIVPSNRKISPYDSSSVTDQKQPLSGSFLPLFF